MEELQTERLNHNKEMAIMKPKTNRKNMKAFSNITKFFFYDEKTNKRIEDAVSNTSRPYKVQYLDSYLKLNSQRRAWFSLGDLPKEMDEGWAIYRDTLYKMFELWTDPSNIEFKKIKALNEYKLFDYEIYKKGIFEAGKQKFKLFKFILKEQIMPEEDVKRITTIKQTSNKIYMCISRNPIDYLMIATNQSFSSCMSLTSSYSSAYYMGLGATVLDPNRFLVFLTNGRQSKYDIHRNHFKHFRYICRSWVLLLKHNSMHVVNTYPGSPYNFTHLLKQAGFNTKKPKNNYKSSQFTWEAGRHCKEIDKPSSIYLDSIGIKYTKKRIRKKKEKKIGTIKNPRLMPRSSCNNNQETHLVYHGGGNSGDNICPNFQWDEGFGELSTVDCLESRSYCNWCDQNHNTQSYMTSNGDAICERCYENYSTSCERCDAILHEDDLWSADDGYYCHDCFHEIYMQCYNCGDNVHIEDTRNVNVIGRRAEVEVCERCFDNHYIKCDHCNDYHHRADTRTLETGENICNSCIRDDFSECEECGKLVLTSDMPDDLCADCNKD